MFGVTSVTRLARRLGRKPERAKQIDPLHTNIGQQRNTGSGIVRNPDGEALLHARLEDTDNPRHGYRGAKGFGERAHSVPQKAKQGKAKEQRRPEMSRWQLDVEMHKLVRVEYPTPPSVAPCGRAPPYPPWADGTGYGFSRVWA